MNLWKIEPFVRVVMEERGLCLLLVHVGPGTGNLMTLHEGLTNAVDLWATRGFNICLTRRGTHDWREFYFRFRPDNNPWSFRMNFCTNDDF